MRVSHWIIFALATAYCVDTLMYEGAHVQTLVVLARNVMHGILLGFLQYA
jgi:hypothetical protein